jgi:alpha-L-fucosidase 2
MAASAASSSSSLFAAAAALVAATLSSAAPVPPPSPPTVALDVDFSSFLSRSDPVWSWNTSAGRPSEWVQSLFGGNADLGFMLWQDDASLATVRLDVSRTVVYDDRTPDLPGTQFLNNFVFDQPRLPVGHFYLGWQGSFSSASARIRLYDGLVALTVTTTLGTLSANIWASADYGTADVIVIETNATAGEAWRVVFVPEIAQSTWSGQDSRYVPNPPPVNASRVLGPQLLLNLTTQPHLLGTAHTTAVLQSGSSSSSPSSAATILTISPVLASPNASDAWATQQVQAAASSLSTLRAAHLAFWNNFWPQGAFVTLDYSLLEEFWWIQLYKFASATRRGRAVHDLEGPWFIDGTPWPDMHTDMNIEQTYFLPTVLSRQDLMQSYLDYLQFLLETGNLNKNVPQAWQEDSAAAPTGAGSLNLLMSCYWNYGPNCTTSPPSITGNLLWMLHVGHLAGRYYANDTVQTDIIWPLLGRALQAYSHFQIPANESADGQVHLPPTFSPEYPGPSGPDANYDLALYRWGLTTVLDLADEYGLTSPNLPAWNATLASLTWYSIDPVSNTFEIYRGTPYGTPHRHYSHLFAIFPIRAIDFTNQTQWLISKESVDRWLATPEEDSQFYRPAASAMNVMLGQRAAAFDNVSYLLHTRIEANTFYREGSQGSCTETPYAAAWAVTDWFFQSWNRTALVHDSRGRPASILDFYPGVDDVIRLDDTPYVAAPSKAATGAFWRLGGEGGFLGSAARAIVVQNATHFITRATFVAVESTAGAPCVVRTTMQRPLVASGPPGVSLTELGDNLVLVSGLGAGQGVAIYSSAFPAPALSVSPLPGCPADFNHYGFPLGSGSAAQPFPPADAVPVVLTDCVYGADGLAQPSQRFTYSPSTNQFALQDGSGRCLTLGACSPTDGTLAVLAPCQDPGNSSLPFGCDSSCGANLQSWVLTGPSASPPNAIQPSGGVGTGMCLDVNGAFNPDVIDVWGGCTPPGEYKNDEWAWNATTGALLTLDTAPQVVGKCITPKGA